MSQSLLVDDFPSTTVKSRRGEYRHIRARRVQDVTVLQFIDHKLLSPTVVGELDRELIEYVELNHPRKVLVDFLGVTHSFTSVINSLLRVKSRVTADGGKFRLCGMCDSVREAYRMLNLEGCVFDIRHRLDDGLAGWIQES